MVSQGALLKSDDGGRTWSNMALHGLPNAIGKSGVAPVMGFASSLNDSRHLYVLTEVHGVFRSDDAGADWESASNGLPVPFHHRTDGSLLTVDPENSSRVYALLNVPVNSHRTRTILFQSFDAGRSWQPLKEFHKKTAFSGLHAGSNGVLTLSLPDGRTL